MADKQDVGVKVSQSGYNARTAPDYALAFSSSWPQLPIVAEFTTTISPFNAGFGPPYSYNPVTFTHKLGYPPFTRCWVTGTGSGIASGHVTSDIYGIQPGVNSIVYDSSMSTTNLTDTLTVFVRVYGLDISKPVSYKYKQPPVISTPYDPDYGFKIVKEGKQITSKDMRDFILHSRCQSPQVDSVNIAPSGSPLVYTNTTGYTNWVFGYGSFDGGTTWKPARTDYQQSPPGLFIVGNVYTNGTNVGGGITGMIPSIVVLRDPLFVPAEVSIIY